MEPLTIKTFKPDKISAISADQRSGEFFNYTSVMFAYDGGEIPPIHIDGNFRLFRFRNKHGDIYSLSITCNATNEWFFRELCKVISRESCKLVRNNGGKILKPEDFELVKDNKSGRSVYANIYSKMSGKVKCRISLGNSRNIIGVEELVDGKFEGSCIIKLHQAYLGLSKSISLSVEEILARKIGISESYFEDEDSESDEE